MNAVPYKGPYIPLIGRGKWSGGLVQIYAIRQKRIPIPEAGIRPEIASLMDVGLYGSAVSALAIFESLGLPLRRIDRAAQNLFGRPFFVLGVQGDLELHVEDDRSADLGFALALFGALSGKPLNHVIATGSLRRNNTDTMDGSRPGTIFPVSSLGDKLHLVKTLLEQHEGQRLLFLYPARTHSRELHGLNTAYSNLSTHAEQFGSQIDLVPVATVSDALEKLKISQQERHPFGKIAVLISLVSSALLVSGLSIEWYRNRPIKLSWATISVGNTNYQTPFWISSRQGSASRVCQMMKGDDNIAIAEIGSRVAFAVQSDIRFTANSVAIVVISEKTGLRLQPTPLSKQYENPYGFTFVVPVEKPEEYSRVAVISKRVGGINFGNLMEELLERQKSSGEDTSIDAVTNALRSDYPGYLEFGFRSVTRQLQCE